MNNRNMHKNSTNDLLLLIGTLLIGSLLTGCASSNESPSSELTTLFREVSGSRGSSLGLERTRSQVTETSNSALFEAIFFKELEIVAYSYRPGMSLQSLGGFSDWSKDWSYWTILQGGVDASDRILKVGQEVNVSSWGEQNASPPSAEFMEKEKAFSVDFLELALAPLGVVYDHQLFIPFGPEGFTWDRDHQRVPYLYRENAFASYPITTAQVQYPTEISNTVFGGAMSVLFVRNDWFSKPVTIGIDPYAQRNAPLFQSSRALSPQEETVLKSLVAQGTRRRAYNSIMIIPFKSFDGPLIVNFPSTPPSDAQPVQFVQGGPKAIWANNIKISVNFDVSDALAENAFQVDEAGNRSVLLKGNAEGIPLGLSVDISEKN